jgi:hypothetical protein
MLNFSPNSRTRLPIREMRKEDVKREDVKRNESSRFHVSRFILLLFLAGCVRTQTFLVQPGQPIRLLTPVTVAAKSTATEVAKGQWIVNDGQVVLPAGAYVVVLSTQPTTQP